MSNSPRSAAARFKPKVNQNPRVLGALAAVVIAAVLGAGLAFAALPGEAQPDLATGAEQPSNPVPSTAVPPTAVPENDEDSAGDQPDKTPAADPVADESANPQGDADSESLGDPVPAEEAEPNPEPAVPTPAPAEVPVAEDPLTEDPITEDPITEDPITEDPLTEDPITEPTPAPTVGPGANPESPQSPESEEDDFPEGAPPLIVEGLERATPSPGSGAWTADIAAPPPVPTPRPTIEPVEVALSLAPIVHPPAEVPPADPVAIPVFNEGGAPGGLTGNEFGCKSRCITRALLSKPTIQPDLALEMVTNVATTKLLWVLPNGPAVVNGVPAHIGKAPRAISGPADHNWDITIGSLEYETSYRVVVSATDLQGNSAFGTTIVTTRPEPADQLVGDASSPCFFGCIVSGVAHPGPEHHNATVWVEMTGWMPEIDIRVSDSPPGTIGDNPFMPVRENVDNYDRGPTITSAEVTGLDADTTYYVWVKVTDHDGYSSYATGEFRTLPVPPPPPPPPPPTRVAVVVQRIHVHENGDNFGRGEMTFRYAPTNDITYEILDEDGFFITLKVSDGDGIPAGGGGVVDVYEGQELPNMWVQATEFDDLSENTQADAVIRHATLEWIRDRSNCDAYGIAWQGPEAETYCVVVSSKESQFDGEDDGLHPRFDVLVSYHIL